MLLKRPGNVLLANNGPAVIDWAKVARRLLSNGASVCVGVGRGRFRPG